MFIVRPPDPGDIVVTVSDGRAEVSSEHGAQLRPIKRPYRPHQYPELGSRHRYSR